MYPKIQNNAKQQIIEKCIRSLKSSTGRNSTKSSLLSRSRRPQTNFNLTGSSVFLQSTVHLFAWHSDYLWIYFDCLSFENILLWQLPPQLRLNVNQMGELKGRLTHDGHIGHLTTTPPYVLMFKKIGVGGGGLVGKHSV